MPRPRKHRRIQAPPRFDGFKPRGVPGRLLKTITLSVEEYECIRLADFEQLEHLEASQKMGVSRSVFTRMLQEAHYKLSRVIIEGCILQIEGGTFQFMSEYYRCKDCFSIIPSKTENCPECGSEKIESLNNKFINS